MPIYRRMSSVGAQSLFKTFCNFFIRKSQVPDKEKAKMTEITETYLEAFPDLKKMSVKNLVKQPQVKEPEVKEPDVKEPEVKEPEVKEPEVKEHDVKEPEVKEPEVKEPECSECCNECKNLETIDLKVDSPISKVTFAPVLVDIIEAPILSDIIGIDSPLKQAPVEALVEKAVEAPVEKAVEEADEEYDEESDEEALEEQPVKEVVEKADEQADEDELTPDFIHLTEPEEFILNKDELVAGSPDADLTPEFTQLPELSEYPETEDFILNKDDLLAGSPESINLLDSYKPKESNIHDLD